ncbi:MAG TPA: VLRF1 family aeRF1-type release factor [candidate division Zixibacteria bacterium]|nr:VLRF1 family aeRF1-type release factor [candidate division Zixibacteria bacterium]
MITRDDIQDLLQRKPVPGSPVLSVYLDLDQSKASNLSRRFEVTLRDMLRRVEARLKDTELENFSADAARAHEHVAALRPEGKSLVLFCDRSEDFLWARQINAPVRSQANWTDRPYVLPLLNILDDYERYGVALVDKAQARLFTIFMGEIEEQQEAWADASVRHVKTTGTDHLLSERHFQRRAATHAHWHLKRVAEMLNAVVDRYGFDRLLLAGPPEATGELQSLLSKRVRARVVERIALPVTASAHEVLQETLRVERQIEQEFEKRLVRELIAADGHQPATLGLERTIQALCEERIWRLVYAAGFNPKGGCCENCNLLLASTEGACRYCGGAVRPVSDLMERMAERVVEQDGKVEQVQGDAAELLRGAGGIGAFLRF